MKDIPLLVADLVRKTGERRAYDIAKSLGIVIRETQTPKHVNGFLAKLLSRKFIVVNCQLEDWQKRAIVAHELGHTVLHPHYRYCCSDERTIYRSARMEREADEFATEMFRQLSTIEPEQIAGFLDCGWK